MFCFADIPNSNSFLYIIYFENMLQILVSLYKTVTCGHNYNSVLVIPFQYYM